MQLYPSLISPGENFDVFYYLRNHTDSTTYYVRAKIYDVRSGDVLQTINLTQSPNNTHLYAKTVQAPPDAPGYGRNIVAIATVYTDSGYTTKSTDYEEQEQYFLVRALPPLLGGGGGIDYREIRDMMREEIGKAIKSIPPAPRQTPVSLEGVYGALGALQREVNRIPKEMDVSDVLGLLRQVQRSQGSLQADIAAIPAPEQPDFSPVMGALNTLSTALSAIEQRVTGMGAAQASTLTGEVRKALDGLKATITEAIQSHEITVPLKGMAQPKEPTPSPISVDHLM
jgi:hypothetical protein